MNLPPPPADTSVLLLLQRATHGTLQALSADLVDLDLSAAEINAPANLADGRPRTVTELSVAVGTRPPTMSGVLDRLERRGHIERGVHVHDRRAVVIELTAHGRWAAATIGQAIADLEDRALRHLPGADLDAFRTVIVALAEVAG